MALRLTHENLPAAYEYLRACRPFCQWKLPHADEVEFRVTRHGDRFGHFDDKDSASFPVIAVSEIHVKSTQDLLSVMSHEMAHQRLFLQKHRRWDAHGAAFQRLATRICAAHGFDRESF